MHFQLRLKATEKSWRPVYEPRYDRQFDLKDLYGHPQHRKYFDAFIAGKWRFTEDEDPQVSDGMRASFAADFAAMLATGLVFSGQTESVNFLERQLEACGNKIINLGFKEVTPLDVRHGLQKRDGDTEIVVLVPGCQDDYMLDRRVNALVDFTINQTEAGVQFKVILSGRCPKQGIVQLQDEASRMANKFRRRLCVRKPDLINVIDVIPISGEKESSDTKENIENFLDHKSFRDAKGPVIVVIISSTFHLIRLWQAFVRCCDTEMIKDQVGNDHHEILRPTLWGRDVNGKKIRLQGAMGREIKEVYLIGAEDQWHRKGVLVDDKDFIKLMLFDIYRTYLTEQPSGREKKNEELRRITVKGSSIRTLPEGM